MFIIILFRYSRDHAMYHWEDHNEWEIHEDKDGDEGGHDDYAYPKLGDDDMSPGELTRGPGSTRQARSRNIRYVQKKRR